jgi:glycosyltransferase involved in cell wall biosynthesis
LAVGVEDQGFPEIPFVLLNGGRQNHSYFVRKIFGAATLLRTGSRRSLSKSSENEAVKLLRRRGVATILAEYGPVGCAVRHIAERSGARLFVHFHGFDASSLLKDRRVAREYRKLFSECAGVVVPSGFLGGNLEAAGCPQDKIHLVASGVDLRKFVQPDVRPEGKKFLAVGRMVEKKAPEVTLRAFSEVATRHADAELLMVGDGPLLGRCRQAAGELGLNRQVHFVGVQSHEKVRKAMQEANVFVQHSVTASDGDTEGLPVAILEAMASGLPVVSTWHSGIPEAVEDGVTGFLVAEGDWIAMGRAMLSLMEHPGRAQNMGQAGRNRVVGQFSSEISISRLRSVLMDCQSP